MKLLTTSSVQILLMFFFNLKPASACVEHTLSAAASYDLTSALFPTSHKYTSGFTTASGVSVAGVTTTPLQDKPLNVIKVTTGLTHNVVTQSGKTSWQADYPKGSWNPSNTPKGGFGFYLGGTNTLQSEIQNGANHVLFSYSLMFQSGWQWNMGGKLPGGFGGVGSSAYGCSGGRQDDRAECFDLRLMWRTNGAGELYTYLPLTDKNNDAQLAVEGSEANSDYGYSIGRGAFTFPAGQWVTVAERIKLNDPSSYNGEVEIWFNGKSVIHLKGVSFRTTSDSVVQGMHFQTFFGGSTSDWSSPQNQSAWFADISGAVISS